MADRPLVKTLLAFWIVYFVWGSTFLAIRVGVRAMPPLVFAAMRFTVAGVLLYGWTRMRGGQAPSGRQWRSVVAGGAADLCMRLRASVLGRDAGGLGNRRGDDGYDPGIHGDCRYALLRTRRFTLGLGAALLVGLAGVAVLTLRPGRRVEQPSAERARRRWCLRR